MSWNQIREIEKSDLVTIGNHSHSHEYLIDWENKKVKNDFVSMTILLTDIDNNSRFNNFL